MTGKSFLELKPGDQIESNDETLEVVQTDKMGRVQVESVHYYVDTYYYMDEYFKTEEEAKEYQSTQAQNLKDELNDLNKQLSGADDKWKDEIQEEIDEIEKKIDDLEYADIKSETYGKPFWMHYKDI